MISEKKESNAPIVMNIIQNQVNSTIIVLKYYTLMHCEIHQIYRYISFIV